MPGLQSLKAWTEGKHFARLAYRATMQRPLAQHFSLADQIRRAAASIPANIAEGYALGTRPQFVRFLRISLGSARELMWHIELAGDMDLIAATDAKTLHDAGDIVIRLLIGLLKKLSG